MRNTSRRTTKLIGSALFAAAIAATSVATVSPVSADVGDLAVGAADGSFGAQIRVKPVNAAPGSGTSAEDQQAKVIVAGALNQPASDVQLLIPSDWEAGDRITLVVQADGSLGAAPISQTNCLDMARTISFAGTADVVVTGGPWLRNQGWSLGDGFSEDAGESALNNSDPRVAGTQTVKPAFTVEMKNDGTSCAGQPTVKNQIEIIFSNSASPVNPGLPPAAPSTDVYELTVSKIAYNVGTDVNAGPVHLLPYARASFDGAPNVLNAVPGYFSGYFGAGFGNNFNDTSTSQMFTNNAIISPVTITATGGSLVADGVFQALGSVTITELVGDALDSGVHQLFIPNVTLAPGATVAVTGNGAATGSLAIVQPFDPDGAGPMPSGARIDLTLVGMTAAKGAVTISGLIASTTTPGDVLIYVLGPPSPTKPLAYLTPDDQRVLPGPIPGFGANDAILFSDVNIPTLMQKFTTAVGVPNRIGGNDRYETSAKIAANVSRCADTVVVVSGAEAAYADALSANYLAGTLYAFGGAPFGGGVPVLLVGTDSVPPSVAAYMAAAGVKNVYIVGGTSAVSAAVEAALKDTPANKCFADSIAGPTAPQTNAKLLVRRVSGADRYATNRAVVNLAADIYPFLRNNIQLELLQPGKRTAIVATGSSFADALAAGPASYNGLPLILTDGTTLSADAKGALTDNDITQVIIIGGTAAVSDVVKASIEALNGGITTGRVSGADRYATATAWADFMAKTCVSTPLVYDCGLRYGPSNRVLLASGTSFADALSAGPLGALLGAPIVLTDPTTLSAATQTWLAANKATIDYLTVLGLGSAVSTGVMNAANLAIS